ncbi:MAG: hypothetical protein E7284_05385 [Lachnospiraceae bacterium]|nr:hypothetical protein [Lachnospiraceae bacterium]
MPKKTKKIIIISVVIGIALFLGLGILLFVLMSSDGNSAMSLKMILISDQYSEEEKLEHAHQYIHSFATEIDSELHMMEYEWDRDDENWDYAEDGAKLDISGIKIPRYIRMEEVCTGDIGNDGTMDMAIVYSLHVKLSRNKIYDDGTRIICLYRQNADGIYEYWQENKTLLNSWSYVDNNKDYSIIIDDGIFYCFVDDFYYLFDIHDENLVMTGYEVSSSVDVLDRYVYRDWNYEDGTMEATARAFGDDESIKICEESFEPELIAFEDIGKEGIVYPSHEFQGYLPVMYKLEHSNNRIQLHASEWSMRPENTGAKILEYIKDTYYPHMVRVEMGYSDEVIANNVELLGYAFPTYYYRDAQGNLLYFCDTYPSGYWNDTPQDCIIHDVIYEDSAGNKYRYLIEDASMEVISYLYSSPI